MRRTKMYSKQDIIDYLIAQGGMLDTETYSYPSIQVVKEGIGYLFHIVDSDLCFCRDTYMLTRYDNIAGRYYSRKIEEHTILYHSVEEFGIDIILKEF